MKEKEYENCLDLVNIKKKSKKEKLAFLLDDEISIEEQIESSDKWEDHWIDMPEFEQEDDSPHRKLIVSFRNEEDFKMFSKLINQNLTKKTKSIWYPELEKEKIFLKRWIDEE